MELVLKRVEFSDEGAFGVLQWGRRSFALTIERTYPGPYNSNVVKIPPGLYKLERSTYNKPARPYPTWKIVGGIITPDREIKFHKANWETDVDGCIGVAESFEVLNGRPAVANSAGGFRELMSLTTGLSSVDFVVINC